MTKHLKFGIPAAVLAMGMTFSLTTSFAKPEFSKKEKTACITCHVSVKSKDLNKTGECYKAKKDVAACKDAK